MEEPNIPGAFSISWLDHFQIEHNLFLVCKRFCLGLPDLDVPASIPSWEGSHWECCKCRWSWTLWRLPTWCQPQDIAWAQWCCDHQPPHLKPIFWNNPRNQRSTTLFRTTKTWVGVVSILGEKPWPLWTHLHHRVSQPRSAGRHKRLLGFQGATGKHLDVALHVSGHCVPSPGVAVLQNRIQHIFRVPHHFSPWFPLGCERCDALKTPKHQKRIGISRKIECGFWTYFLFVLQLLDQLGTLTDTFFFSPRRRHEVRNYRYCLQVLLKFATCKGFDFEPQNPKNFAGKIQHFVRGKLSFVRPKFLNPCVECCLHALPQSIFALILVLLHVFGKACAMGLYRAIGACISFFASCPKKNIEGKLVEIWYWS